MKNFLVAAFLLIVPAGAWAVCPNPLTVKDAAGATQNLSMTNDGTGNCQSNVVVPDGNDAAEGATTDAAATAGGTGTVSAKLRNATASLGTLAGAVSSSVVQSNTKQVNGITTSTGAGATGTGTQRVGVAQDATTIAGAAPGTVAPGAAPANTVMAGCQYNASNPTATDTQGVSVQCDANGRLKVNNQPSTANFVSGTATQTSTTSTSLIGAVASNRIYVTSFACYNSGSSASVVSFQDGNGGTTIGQTIVPAGGGSNLGVAYPMFRTTSGNALYFAPGTASTTVGCTAAGFSGS